MAVQRTEYAGFELERQRSPLADPFPAELGAAARDALTTALLEDRTQHPDQRNLTRARARLDEYWRRSGGEVKEAAPDRVREMVRAQLEGVKGWNEFLSTRLDVEVDTLVPESVRAECDSLPTSIPILGDRVPLVYEVESGKAIARVQLREGQARRLKLRDLPPLDRPLRFAVQRKHGSAIKAETLEALKSILNSLPHGGQHPKHRGKRRSRR